MKFFIVSLFLIHRRTARYRLFLVYRRRRPPRPPPTAAARTGPAPGAGRAPVEQSAADVAEIAKLMDLPAWGQNLADGDYSNGPAYPTAPELAKRAGVPEGKVIEFVMNSSESKFYPGANGAFSPSRVRLCSGGVCCGNRTSGDRRPPTPTGCATTCLPSSTT